MSLAQLLSFVLTQLLSLPAKFIAKLYTLNIYVNVNTVNVMMGASDDGLVGYNSLAGYDKLCTSEIYLHDNFMNVTMAASDEGLVGCESLAGYNKVIEFGIRELKSGMGNCNVVGLDIKFTQSNSPVTLLLSVESFCLVVKLQRLEPVCRSLKDFLHHPDICFVSRGTTIYRLHRLRPYDLVPENIFSDEQLIVIVPKTWAKLSVEVPSKGDLEHNASGFCENEIRCLVHKAHWAFLVGKRLLDCVR